MANRRRRRPSQRSWSRYAAKSVVTGTAVFSPLSLSPELWLRFDDYGLADDAAIATATDLSGNGNDFTQGTADSRPTFKTNIVNGHGVARFDGTADHLAGPDFSSLTAGEIFVIVKIDTDPPAAEAQTGLWHFGDDAVSPNGHFPFTDGAIYEGFGTDTRKTVGDPTPSLATAFRLYNVVSASGSFAAFLDGTEIFSTGTNTVAFDSAPHIGKSDASLHFLDGDIAEIILFSSPLSAGDKTLLKDYFADRYALTIA